MELRKAIQQVAKVIPRKKDSLFRFIRFLPRDGVTCPRVFATDGFRIAVADVDLDSLPNVMLEADLVVQASKDSKGIGVAEVGLGNLELKTDDTVYRVKGVNFDDYPVVPVLPKEFTEISLGVVAKVLHAADKEETSDLAVVRFTPTHVEALDKVRLARVEVEGNWSGLVPSSTFRSWPKGAVEMAFTTGHAFFRINKEELRIGIIQVGEYPDTTNVLPADYLGPSVLVNLKAVRNAVLQGSRVSELGLVKLEFEEGGVVVRAWQEGEVGKAFESKIPILHKWHWNAGSVLVNGKYTDQALRVVNTPNVKLGYGEIADPLYIESGAYTACIWQLAYGGV